MTFEWAYRQDDAPWDIGGPQPAVVQLAEAGAFAGKVLDAGCGTGENVLYLASLGLDITGVDAAPTAIARAQAKAKDRGLDAATFIVGDALALDELGMTFDTGFDCGLFHTFSDAERIRFERALHGVVRPGGRYYVLCFSEAEPGSWGPRRVTPAEIRTTFRSGWTVDDIVATRFAARFAGGAAAWLASVTRV